MPEIVLDDLCKDFDGHVAADHLSLTIGDGEYVCILGPTGAGKTTAMRMICGLTIPDSGRVLLDGRDVTMDSPDSRNATMLTQTYALFPHMTVYNNVMFAPKTKGWPEDESRQIVRSMLHRSSGACCTWCISTRRQTGSPGSYREGSSSASPSRVRSRPGRRSSCWTSRSGRWTRV